ncbi:hypothetical protein [Acidaminococcus provencensis]|uniref:hypothetical protein n=1 Tax=Acidaminococcus provencensis TaxID=2058289 RepID=UPI0022E69348|nr:hypothetical protein [Acidaminococcus provencensis]
MNDFWSGLVSGLVSGDVNSVILSAGGDSLTLPIMPESVEVCVSQNNSTVTINNDGEYNMVGKTGLHEIGLDGLFPAQDYSFCDTTPDSPDDYVYTIENWRKEGTVVQLTVPDSPIDFSFLISSFKYGYQDGTYDIFFHVDLKEYRYIAGISNDKINELTGLKSRPDTMVGTGGIISMTANSYDDMVGNIGKAIGKAARSGTTSPISYLEAASRAVKKGGVKPGDLIKVAASGVNVNDRIL